MKPVFKVLLMAIAYLATFILGASSGIIHPACYAYIGAVLPLVFAFIYLYTCSIIRGFGAAAVLNGFVLVLFLIVGEADTPYIIGTVILTALMIPFLGTALGSAFVFFMKREMPPMLQKVLLGFASGVMVAASVWSLIIPAIEMGQGVSAVVPPVIGLLAGFAFLLLIDYITPHIHPSGSTEGPKSRLSRTAKLALAVTIHNFPEGAIISMPLRAEGNSRWRSFGIGALSGIVEPIGGALVLLLATSILGIMPYMLAFAAGAMLYVVVEELVPDYSQGKHSNIGTVGFALGFALMMVLDVVLG